MVVLSVLRLLIDISEEKQRPHRPSFPNTETIGKHIREIQKTEDWTCFSGFPERVGRTEPEVPAPVPFVLPDEPFSRLIPIVSALLRG